MSEPIEEYEDAPEPSAEPQRAATPALAPPQAAAAPAPAPSSPASRRASLGLALAGAALWAASCASLAAMAVAYGIWSMSPPSDDIWSLLVGLASAPAAFAWGLASAAACSLALMMFSKPTRGASRAAKQAKLLHLALCGGLALGLEAAGFCSLALRQDPGAAWAWAGALLGPALAGLCARRILRDRTQARDGLRDLGHYPGASWMAAIAMGWFALGCALGPADARPERLPDALSALSRSNAAAVESANKEDGLRAESESELASAWRAKAPKGAQR